MQLNPYLTFKGQCEAAFKFYEKCLGGKIVAMLTHAGTPAEQHVPPEWRNKILHAYMIVGDQVLMGSDAPPDRYQEPKGFSVSLTIKDVRFGMLVDQFGIPWMINCAQAAKQTA